MSGARLLMSERYRAITIFHGRCVYLHVAPFFLFLHLPAHGRIQNLSALENMKIAGLFGDGKDDGAMEGMGARDCCDVAHVDFAAKAELRGKVGRAAWAELVRGGTRTQSFDHGAGVEDVAAGVDKDSAVEIYGVDNAAAPLSPWRDLHDVDMMPRENILRRIGRIGIPLPFAFPSKDNEHAEFFSALHNIQHQRRHPQRDRRRDAGF